MGTIEGLTKARMLAIEAASVVGATVNGAGDLVFSRFNGTTIAAGNIKGPKGDPGDLVGAAGGDLSGNFPNPVIGALKVITSKIADGAVTKAKLGPDALLAAYPVGAIYMSTSSTNPSTLFGGTWAAWGAGRVPVGVDPLDTDFNAAEKTGGAKTHTLTTAEMPAHTHSVLRGNAIGNSSNKSVESDVSDANLGDGATSSTGNDQPHNNMQPYIVCYMWKRTA